MKVTVSQDENGNFVTCMDPETFRVMVAMVMVAMVMAAKARLTTDIDTEYDAYRFLLQPGKAAIAQNLMDSWVPYAERLAEQVGT